VNRSIGSFRFRPSNTSSAEPYPSPPCCEGDATAQTQALGLGIPVPIRLPPSPPSSLPLPASETRVAGSDCHQRRCAATAPPPSTRALFHRTKPGLLHGCTTAALPTPLAVDDDGRSRDFPSGGGAREQLPAAAMDNGRPWAWRRFRRPWAGARTMELLLSVVTCVHGSDCFAARIQFRVCISSILY
jgi:hypothetical protein